MKYLSISLFAAVCLALYSWNRVPSDFTPRRIQSLHLPNLIQVHPRIFSGGEPHDAAAFAELQQRGIQTVISVDGQIPNAELASQFGLRYVHLPHGYEGISTKRTADLAVAFMELPGPIYVHCHHGKHRSPAAAATGCVAAGMLPPKRAPQILQLAGTATKYAGLHRVAAQARCFTPAELSAVSTEWTTAWPISHTVRQMVLLEQLQTEFQHATATKWQSTTLAERATVLRETFTELIRDPQTGKYPLEYASLLQQCETAALNLESKLASDTIQRAAECQAAWLTIQQNCQQCHQKFRD